MLRSSLRLFSSGRTAAESRMSQLLSQRFPQAKEVRVEDVSSKSFQTFVLYKMRKDTLFGLDVEFLGEFEDKKIAP